MKHIGKKAVSLTLAGALSLGLLAGCGSTEQTGGSETPAGSESPAASSAYQVDTLRLEGGTDYGAPNPFLHNSRGPGAAKMRLVYGSLLEKDEEGDVSWLAESWTVDGSDYTFTLFENATFQDGEPLTAQDVAFTYNTVKNSSSVNDFTMLDYAEATDETTVVFHMTRPFSIWPYTMAIVGILPEHAYDPAAYKNTLPILDYFLMEINGNTLKVTTSDLETTLVGSIDVESVESEARSPHRPS